MLQNSAGSMRISRNNSKRKMLKGMLSRSKSLIFGSKREAPQESVVDSLKNEPRNALDISSVEKASTTKNTKADFQIDGKRATSIFTLFEDRLTQIKKNEDDQSVPEAIRRSKSNFDKRSLCDGGKEKLVRFKSASSSRRAEMEDQATVSDQEQMSALRKKWKRRLSEQPERNVVTFPEEKLVEEMDTDCRRIIISGQPRVLLLLLINPQVEEYYPNYTEDFMLTYHFHMTDQDLLRFLFEEFKIWSSKACDSDKNRLSVVSEESVGRLWILSESSAFSILLRIVYVLNICLEEYSYFDHPSVFNRQVSDEHIDGAIQLLLEFSSFIEKHIKTHPKKPVRVWYSSLKKNCQKVIGKYFKAFSDRFPENFIGMDIMEESNGEPSEKSELSFSFLQKPTKAAVLDLDANQLFKQLTMIELDLFKKIRPLDLYYKSKGMLDKAPNLKELIERFNTVSYWVATEICVCRDIRTRTNVLKLFINVAQLCFDWNNFNTSLQIVAALSMTCVQRLKATWKALPKKQQMRWRNLSTTFSAARNYSTYRKDVLSKLSEDIASDQTKPNSQSFSGGIPFMGIHLSDLLFIEEANGKTIQDGMINFAKMRLIAATFRKLVALQKVTEYPFEVDPFTRRFLTFDMLILDEDKLWKASRICEAPEEILPRKVRYVPSFYSSEESSDEEEEEVTDNSLEEKTRVILLTPSLGEKQTQTLFEEYAIGRLGSVYRLSDAQKVSKKIIRRTVVTDSRKIYLYK